MIPLIIQFIFNKILITLAVALYLSLQFNKDAKLLLLFRLAFELGSLLPYVVSLFQ